jgi:D-alanyl-D-alanine carboxypeptidase
MFRPVLSVLLFGLIPALGGVESPARPSHDLSVAPPALFHFAATPQAFGNKGYLSASGMIIVDLHSGEKLSARNPKERRPVASLTKLMTALIIVENHDLSEEVVVPNDLLRIAGSQTYLPPGQHFTVGSLLSAMLIASANDAAETLARYHSGSSEQFVELMNERAAVLGLRDTSYDNPIGLDGEDAWSTPQDIAWLTLFALRSPEIRSRMSTPSLTIKSREGTAVSLTHTHMLLRTAPPSFGGSDTAPARVIAGKTGTTDYAKQCAVSVISQGKREYLVVLLDSNARYEDLRSILKNLQPPPSAAVTSPFPGST